MIYTWVLYLRGRLAEHYISKAHTYFEKMGMGDVFGPHRAGWIIDRIRWEYRNIHNDDFTRKLRIDLINQMWATIAERKMQVITYERPLPGEANPPGSYRYEDRTRD